jgi:serine/threonine protein kinase
MPPLPQPSVGPPQAQVPASGAIAFETLAEIAAGATARVDLCRLLPPHPRAGGLVAVKRLHPHIAEDPTFVRQFLDEVRITYWLRHPNVVEVAGWGTDEQGSYLAVELVQGVSLLRLMKTIFETGEAFNERMVVYLAACVCRGLGAAHSLRAPDGEMLHLVHRDLTPGNVLVGFNGEIKITDFGMAKAKQRLTKTLTGMRKGEPTYMAPEQAQSDEIDARADLFSLGVILFELFAGRRPWIAKSDFEMVQITTREAPADLRELRPKIDKELVNVVNRCLERDPRDRYQSAHEIGARLDEWLTVHGYQEQNDEALGRFVRRNAMRQMRWFERAIAGDLHPQKMGRELPPRVPTYTEHTPRVGDDLAILTPSASMPRQPSQASPRQTGNTGPSQSGRPVVPPRPGAAPADPRSIRAANAVQQLKKLAPAVEPPRSRGRRGSSPGLDDPGYAQRPPRVNDGDEDGDVTDVEVKGGAHLLQRGLPRALPDGDDDMAGEEVPTLVQRGDADMEAFRAEARAKHAARTAAAAQRGAAAGSPGVSRPRLPYTGQGIIDEESDQRVTEVKRGEDQRSAAQFPNLIGADVESDLPTAPIHSGRPRLPPEPDDAPTPIARQRAKTPNNLGSPVALPRPSREHGPDPSARQVIPRSPDIPPRPFATGPSARTNKSASGPSAGPGEQAAPPNRTTSRPPPLFQEAQAQAPQAEVPPSSVSSPSDPMRTSQHDDVQRFDRNALQQAQQKPALNEDAVVAEADRLAIEAVRRSEEARAAQLRAERKAQAAKLAGEAAMIAADAVRLIRTEGIAAATRRLEEARGLEQNLQSGKFPNGEVSGAIVLTPSSFPGPASHPHPHPNSRAEASSKSVYPEAPPLPSIYMPPPAQPSGPIFAGAAASSSPIHGYAAPRPEPRPPPQSLPPEAPAPQPSRSPVADAEAFRAQLQPSFMGLPGVAVAGLVIIALLLVLLLVMLVAK